MGLALRPAFWRSRTVLSAPQRTAVLTWLQTGLLAANLLWTTVCLGGFRAETMVVTAALTGALLLVHAVTLIVSPEACPLRLRVGAAFVPFLVYAAANVLWVTPVKWLGWIDWFGWFQAIAVTWIALDLVKSRGLRRALWATLAAAGIGAVVLAAYQRFSDPQWLMLGRLQVEQYAGRSSGPFGIPNSLAALLLLLLPACGALAVRPRASAVERVFFGWTTLVLLFGLALTISRGAWLGLAIALMSWPLLRPQGTWRSRLQGAAAAALLAGLAAGLTYATSERVRGRVDALIAERGERSRLILWRAGWTMVQERPWLGTGAGSFNTEFERHRPEGFLQEPMWTHNDYLNTLSDYGVVGMALLVGPLLWLARRRGAHGGAESAGYPRSPGTPLPGGYAARTRAFGSMPLDAFDDPLFRQALRVGVLAFALQLFVDFHFKIPALALAFAVVVALGWRAGSSRSCSPVEPAASARRGERLIAAGVLLAAVLAIGTFFVPLYRAEALRQRGREAIDRLIGAGTDDPRFRPYVETAVAVLEDATRLMPLHAAAVADLAYAYAQTSLVEPARTVELGRLAEAAADQAIARSPGIAEFWIRRGVARDMQGKYAAAGDDFTRALALAPKAPLPWYHYAYHLSLRPVGVPLAEAMVATCLRLDPKNPEALRLRQQLATARSSP